ncbi:MAG: hypothetical protein QM831_13030 [Kofleriaceae bacterium]
MVDTATCSTCGKQISGAGINFNPSGAPVCDQCIGNAMVQGGNFEGKEYEFDQAENETIRTLAGPMRFVGVLSVVFGVLQLIFGMVGISKNTVGGLVTIGEGVALSLIGFWLTSAASSLKEVVMTEGNDIANLMAALRKLRSVYTLQAWLMGLACALVILLILLVFIH